MATPPPLGVSSRLSSGLGFAMNQMEAILKKKKKTKTLLFEIEHICLSISGRGHNLMLVVIRVDTNVAVSQFWSAKQHLMCLSNSPCTVAGQVLVAATLDYAKAHMRRFRAICPLVALGLQISRRCPSELSGAVL